MWYCHRVCRIIRTASLFETRRNAVRWVSAVRGRLTLIRPSFESTRNGLFSETNNAKIRVAAPSLAEPSGAVDGAWNTHDRTSCPPLMSRASYDIAIVGAGLVGLSTALTIKRDRAELKVIVLEKESGEARHQSGHNSGVVHSGIYYKPGSLKARLCVDGRAKLLTYCVERGIARKPTDKLIVAVTHQELPHLDKLRARGAANGIEGLRLLTQTELCGVEPRVRGLGALYVPVTAIVDYKAVAAAIRADFESRGGQVMTASEVLTIAEKGTGLEIAFGSGTVGCDLLINCAGLHSSRVARLAGAEPSVEIIPFRGEYYVLQGAGRDLVHTLVYPVPDPELPFLGVHFTPHLGGSIEAGPSAVLALAPEGYQRRDVSVGFLLKLARTPNFRRMARRYWRVGAGELARSFSKHRFAEALRALAPEVTASYLGAGGSGVRAQAVDRQGRLVDDFVIEHSARAIHVLNAPSPAATACLAIGEHIADLVFPA